MRLKPTEAEKRQAKYEKMIEYQARSQAKQLEKQRKKQNDPIEKQKEYEKKIKQQQRFQKNQSQKSFSNTTSKPKSRGLKGRSATAQEQSITNAFGKIGCIACLLKGREMHHISMHHTDGRTKVYAHAKQIPLCAHHHDTPAPKELIALYPDLIPFHAKGKLGGKAQWEKLNKTQEELLLKCYELAGLTPPWEID